MSVFYAYFNLGFEHISDVNGYDHILYLLALCAVFKIEDWRKILVVVTAFTIGHSLSLASSVLELVKVDTALVEALIPATILFTSLWNIYELKSKNNQSNRVLYLLTLGFGFVHGLGFSNFFTSIYSDEMSIVLPLFSFNIGLELGQILIVLSFLVLKFLLAFIPKLTHADWVLFFSGIGFGLSLFMFIERIQLI